MKLCSRGRYDDRGETLVEVLAAVVILGIAGVAVMAGLMLSVKTSDIHRKETTGSAYVRNYAEAIQNYVAGGGYQDCASASYTPAAVSFQIPKDAAGQQYNAKVDSAVSVGTTVAASSCTSPDPGVEQLRLSVKSPDGRANEQLVIIVRKPCSTASPC